MEENKQIIPLSQRLAARRQQVSQTARPGQIIAEAKENLLNADLFFKAVSAGDTIGIAYFNAGGKKFGEAVSQWLSLKWDGWFSKIGLLAQVGDPVAKETLGTIMDFAENPLLYAQLREVVWRFERPLRRIHGESHLIKFLDDLTNEGAVTKTSLQPRRKSVRLGDFYYFPSGIDFARLGWPFVVKAVGRIRRREKTEEELLERLQPLLEGATLSSVPEDKGLTHLIEGGTGSVLICDPHSRNSGQETGLLAILVGCFSVGSSLVLMGSIADLSLPDPLPKEDSLLSYELPSLIVKHNNEMEVGFGKLSGHNKEVHQALLRIERLIQWRLRQENKAQALVIVEEAVPAA